MTITNCGSIILMASLAALAWNAYTTDPRIWIELLPIFCL